MRRKDREVTDDVLIDNIIKNCKICRIGFCDNGKVYVVPLNFGYSIENGKRVFYFHSAKEGRKIDLIKSAPEVGFEMDTNYELWEGNAACEYTAGFQSVIGNGTVYLVEELEEKKKALQELMLTNTGKKDWEFDQKMIDSVCIFKLVVEKLSCKEHVRG